MILRASGCRRRGAPIDRWWHTRWIITAVLSRSDRQHAVNQTDTQTRCRCVWSYATHNTCTHSHCSWPLLQPFKALLDEFDLCDPCKGQISDDLRQWGWWELCLLHRNAPSLSQYQSVHVNGNNEEDSKPYKQSNNTWIWAAATIINGQHLWVNVYMVSPLLVDSLTFEFETFETFETLIFS